MRAAHFSEHAEPLGLSAVSIAPFSAVLLIVVALSIVAFPKPLHAIGFDIGAQCSGTKAEPPALTVTIDQNGVVVWEGEVLSSRAALDARMRAVGNVAAADQAEVHLWPHKGASYGAFLAVMVAAQRNGVQRIGMIGETGEILLAQPSRDRLVE